MCAVKKCVTLYGTQLEHEESHWAFPQSRSAASHKRRMPSHKNRQILTHVGQRAARHHHALVGVHQVAQPEVSQLDIHNAVPTQYVLGLEIKEDAASTKKWFHKRTTGHRSANAMGHNNDGQND